jgi:hypothetical protein
MAIMTLWIVWQSEPTTTNAPTWMVVATALLEECEDDTHTPKMGTWESSGTPKTSELDCRGQNTSHWGVLYIIGKI